MKVPFYLLGMLMRFGPQHGYSLKEFVARSVADFANIKLPTIYYHLEKLRQQGFVSATVEKEGNRPEKTVYEITPCGKRHFSALSKKIMEEAYINEFNLDAVLFFIDQVDKAYLVKSLAERKSALEEKIRYTHGHQAAVMGRIPKKSAFWVESIFSHHLCHMEAELAWTSKILEYMTNQ